MEKLGDFIRLASCVSSDEKNVSLKQLLNRNVHQKHWWTFRCILPNINGDRSSLQAIFWSFTWSSWYPTSTVRTCWSFAEEGGSTTSFRSQLIFRTAVILSALNWSRDLGSFSRFVRLVGRLWRKDGFVGSQKGRVHHVQCRCWTLIFLHKIAFGKSPHIFCWRKTRAGFYSATKIVILTAQDAISGRCLHRANQGLLLCFAPYER